MFSIKKNITVRLVWFSILVGLLIGIVLTALQLTQDFRQEKESKEFAIQQILTSLEHSAADAAFHLDVEKGLAVLSGLFVMPGVYRAEIRDDFGSILVQKRSATDPEEPNLFARMVLGEETTRTVILAIDNHPAPLGHMRIWLDLNSMTENFGTRVWLVVVSGLVRNLLMSSALAILFYFFLAKPLVAVATEIEENKRDLDNKNSAVTIPADHVDDELGALLSSFNALVSSHEQAEQNLSATLNSIAEAVISTDNEGRIVSLNPVAEILADRTLEHTLGLPLEKVFNISVINKAYPLNLVEVVDFSAPFLLTTEEGREHQLTISKAPIQDATGEIIGIVFVFRDITEDYALRQALVKSEYSYRSLFENAEVSIWKLDFSIVYETLNKIQRDGITDLRSYLNENLNVVRDTIPKIRVVDVNQATLNLFGATSQKQLLLQVKQIFSEKSLPVFIDEFCAFTEGQTSFLSEITLQNLEGQEIFVIITFQIPQTPEGFKNVSLSLVDITARKQMEVRLQEAKEDAEKANRAKTEFLSSMSHELRTPMNAVLGFAQMLQFDPKEELSTVQNEYVDNIRAGGEHLLELINSILDLVRIESDQNPVFIEDIEANDLVEKCTSLAASLGKSRNITINDTFSGGPPVYLRTDEVQFKQVLLNLLSNAVKYNEDNGSVTISGYETEDDFLRISVSDTGIGIAEKDHNDVFQLFHRLDADPNIAREGTGIGLTVSKLLVDRLAGQIGYESEEGKGSTFWMKFPLTRNSKALIWTDALRVGIDAIDKDHQFLVRLLNTFVFLSVDDDNIDMIINEMLDYTQYHFAREEAIMEVCGYPDQENHVRQHQEFVKHINRLTNSWRQYRDEQTLQDYKELTNNWWLAHIGKVDTDLGLYVNGNEKQIQKTLSQLKLEKRPVITLAGD